MKKLGRFELKRELGRGAFGTVYLALDPQLDRDVALKVPNIEADPNSPKVTRFLREAKAAGGLHHPNIVAVYDAGYLQNTLYIASAYIAGGSLRDVFRSKGKPSFDTAANIVSRLADALFYAHQKGVIHRDIKPENVLLDKEGNPYLVDFGLARREMIDVEQTQDGTLLGTPAYMSPEQASGKNSTVDAKSDQWSLGVILYELLTGARPFQGDTMQVLYAIRYLAPDTPTVHEPTLPIDLQTICMRCLSKEPKDRFTNCQELSRDLKRWSADEPIACRRHSIIERVQRWSRRNPTVSRLSVALVASIVILGTGISTQWIRAEVNAARSKNILVQVNSQRLQLEEQSKALNARTQELDSQNRSLTEKNLAIEEAKSLIEKSFRELLQKDQLLSTTSVAKSKAEEEAQAANMKSEQERLGRVKEQSLNAKLRYLGDIQIARTAIAAGQVERARSLLDQSPPALRSIEFDWLQRLASSRSNQLGSHEMDAILKDSARFKSIVSLHFPDKAREPAQIEPLTTSTFIQSIDESATRWLTDAEQQDVIQASLPKGYLPAKPPTPEKPEIRLVVKRAELYAVKKEVQSFSKQVVHAWLSPNGKFIGCILPRVEVVVPTEPSVIKVRIQFTASLFDVDSEEYFERKLDRSEALPIEIVFKDRSKGFPSDWIVVENKPILAPFMGVFSSDSKYFLLADGNANEILAWDTETQGSKPQTKLSGEVLGCLVSTFVTSASDRKTVTFASNHKVFSIEPERMSVLESRDISSPIPNPTWAAFSKDTRRLAIMNYQFNEQNPRNSSAALGIYDRVLNSWIFCELTAEDISSAWNISKDLTRPDARKKATRQGIYSIDWASPQFVSERNLKWCSFRTPSQMSFTNQPIPGLQFYLSVPLVNREDSGKTIWHGTPDIALSSIRLSDDSSTISIALKNRLYVLKSGSYPGGWKEESVKALAGGDINDVFPHPTMNTVLVGQNNGLSIYDRQKKLVTSTLPKGSIHSILLPMKNRVVFSDTNGYIRIMAENTGEDIKSVQGQRSGKCVIEVDYTRKFLVIAGDDRSLSLWDLVNERSLGSILTDVPTKSLRLNDRSKILAVVGQDNSISLFEWPSLRRRTTFEASELELLSANTSDDGQRLLVVNKMGIQLLDIEYAVTVAQVTAFSSAPSAAIIDNSRSVVFVYFTDGRLAVYQL